MECNHPATEPVIPAGLEVEVGEVCIDCLAGLPVGYSCDDCEHNELRTLNGHRMRIVAHRCDRHARRATL